MPGIGPTELLIVLVIAVVIFGPKRLPELGRSIGEGVRELRSTLSSADPRDDVRSTLASADVRESREPDQSTH